MRRMCIETTQMVGKGYISLEKRRVLLQSVTNKREGVTPAPPTSANHRLRKFLTLPEFFRKLPRNLCYCGELALSMTSVSRVLVLENSIPSRNFLEDSECFLLLSLIVILRS